VILDLSPVNSFPVLTGQFSGCSFQASRTSCAPTLSALSPLRSRSLLDLERMGKLRLAKE